MSQTTNILRKDTRQLWPEILASITVLFFFTVVEPRGWVPVYPSFFSASFLSSILSALLCISWGVLIIRLVQAERLVGLNQFWTTRPYCVTEVELRRTKSSLTK